MKEEARASLRFQKKFKKKIFQDMDKSLNLPLDIAPHLFLSALLGNFKPPGCSQTQLGRDMCLGGAALWGSAGEGCVSVCVCVRLLFVLCVGWGRGVMRVRRRGEGKRFVRAGEV